MHFFLKTVQNKVKTYFSVPQKVKKIDFASMFGVYWIVLGLSSDDDPVMVMLEPRP